jgi:hypothetical protein
MKRAVLIGLGLLMSLALVAPASAFVFVFADIEKTKDVIVTETITITKTATITATVNVAPLAAAEALALANQENIGGSVQGYPLGSQNPAKQNDRVSLIEYSIGTNEKDSNTGIVHVNQDSGNLANQGNNVALAVTDLDTAFANAEASASQINAGNFAWSDDIEGPGGGSQGSGINDNDIENSINNNFGIVGVNQNSGNFNNQLNNVAVAAGLGAAPVALSEADLGQFNACNTVLESGQTRYDTITGSVLSHSGIVGVNQSSGNGNNQATNVALSASVNLP